MFLLTSIAWPYAQVSTLWVRVIFWRYSLTSCYFSNDRRLKFNFFKMHMKEVVFMSRTFKMLISNWPRTRKFNRLLRLHAGKAIAFDLSHCHALITLYVQFLCPDWSWSWQSFVSTCDVLNCLFLLGVQNEIQLLSRSFCNSWLLCLLHFLLTNAPLVKVIGNPISDGIVFKNELTHLHLLEA